LKILDTATDIDAIEICTSPSLVLWLQGQDEHEDSVRGKTDPDPSCPMYRRVCLAPKGIEEESQTGVTTLYNKNVSMARLNDD